MRSYHVKEASHALFQKYIRLCACPLVFAVVLYGGYNCYYVDGVYYRPVFYGGQTVYVVVP